MSPKILPRNLAVQAKSSEGRASSPDTRAISLVLGSYWPSSSSTGNGEQGCGTIYSVVQSTEDYFPEGVKNRAYHRPFPCPSCRFCQPDLPVRYFLACQIMTHPTGTAPVFTYLTYLAPVDEMLGLVGRPNTREGLPYAMKCAVKSMSPDPSRHCRENPYSYSGLPRI